MQVYEYVIVREKKADDGTVLGLDLVTPEVFLTVASDADEAKVRALLHRHIVDPEGIRVLVRPFVD